MQKENGGTSATIEDKEVKTNKKDMIEKEDERSSEVSAATQDKNVDEDDK